MAADPLQLAYERNLGAAVNKLKSLVVGVQKDQQIKAEAIPEADAFNYISTGILGLLSDARKQGKIPAQIRTIEALMNDSLLNSADTLRISTTIFERQMAATATRIYELQQKLATMPDPLATKTGRNRSIEVAFLGWYLSIVRDELMRSLRESYGEQ